MREVGGAGASANLDVNVDANQLTSQIMSMINTSANRGGVVKSIMEAAFYKYNQQFQTERPEQPNRDVQQQKKGRIRKVNGIRKVKDQEIDRTCKEGEVVKFDNSATARPRAPARRGG